MYLIYMLLQIEKYTSNVFNIYVVKIEKYTSNVFNIYVVTDREIHI